MSRTSRHHRPRADAGFTLVELMVVVLIVGILVGIAMPVFLNARKSVERKTCYANQRTIEGMISVWVQDTNGGSTATLAGLVDGAHPLMLHFLIRPPRCPSSPKPLDMNYPAPGDGIYTLDTSGTVQPCTFGSPAHGWYHQ